MIITIIAAATENRVIGKNNELPWKLPKDLARFKKITTGHPIIVGRKTFESFGGKPLPNRKNIIISRNPEYKVDGADVVHSLQDAISICNGEQEVFICGGAEIYRQAIPIAHRMHLTIIHADIKGDTYFPGYDSDEWREVEFIELAADNKHAHSFSWLILERIKR